MKDNVIIRTIAKEDCPSLLSLIKELAAFEKAPQEVTMTVSALEATGFGAHPLWYGFVAEVEHTVVGLAICYIRFSTWKGATAYLEDLLVTETYRGKGIGRLLLDAVIADAKHKNYPLVRWQVLDWNQKAIDFYQKNGAVLHPEWVNCDLVL